MAVAGGNVSEGLVRLDGECLPLTFSLLFDAS
nr:MAG TPA: hypothetical protein [Caudoviricetes sp.]